MQRQWRALIVKANTKRHAQARAHPIAANNPNPA